MRRWYDHSDQGRYQPARHQAVLRNHSPIVSHLFRGWFSEPLPESAIIPSPPCVNAENHVMTNFLIFFTGKQCVAYFMGILGRTNDPNIVGEYAVIGIQTRQPSQGLRVFNRSVSNQYVESHDFTITASSCSTRKAKEFTPLFRRFSALESSATATASARWRRPLIAETFASVRVSAPSYRFAENVGFVPIVKSKLKLIQIQRQIFLADAMVCSDHATLEQRRE